MEGEALIVGGVEVEVGIMMMMGMKEMGAMEAMEEIEDMEGIRYHSKTDIKRNDTGEGG
jgi:hypothetical protein